ncbi:hypothetical protein RHGRI_003889 [Rhododendron griersonianum]|uniref:F-box/LRR-repeat protein 15-like leucin rich repeat domain-containing protein n=1 Tax=Rhododendron griersonianum TaxID=479676 RepID=A0AAV6L7F1_9ERIC|nr:hypothetical protein RHGRI_003889 [Rhododendron griersonianum]
MKNKVWVVKSGRPEVGMSVVPESSGVLVASKVPEVAVPCANQFLTLQNMEDLVSEVDRTEQGLPVDLGSSSSGLGADSDELANGKKWTSEEQRNPEDSKNEREVSNEEATTVYIEKRIKKNKNKRISAYEVDSYINKLVLLENSMKDIGKTYGKVSMLRQRDSKSLYITALKPHTTELKPFIVADLETVLVESQNDDDYHVPYAAGLLPVHPGEDVESKPNREFSLYFSEDIINTPDFEDRKARFKGEGPIVDHELGEVQRRGVLFQVNFQYAPKQNGRKCLPMMLLFNLIVESMEGNVCKELPEDCWESILTQLALDHGYNGLEAPSLVCKQFLLITNRLRRKFLSQNKVFYHNRCEALCRAFQRFRNLKELEICDPSFGVVVDKIMDIDYIISRIASSGLDLQSLGFTRLREPPSKESFLKLGSTMRNLKILRCCIPLEKLSIAANDRYREEDYGFSLHGLSTFLRGCPSMKHLEVWSIYFLNDHAVRDLCRYLSNVVSIKLMHCENLTFSTFFILAKECPMLSEIELIPMSEVGDEFVADLERNDRITSVILCSNWCLTDELLKIVGVLCPNLHTLNVRGCGLLTQEGIGQVLKCCSQMKHLTVDYQKEA